MGVVVGALQVDDLLNSVEKIDIEVRSLDTCAFNSQTFRDVLSKVQKAVDELNLHSYSNLPQWVATLDEQVHSIVAHAALSCFDSTCSSKVNDCYYLSGPKIGKTIWSHFPILFE